MRSLFTLIQAFVRCQDGQAVFSANEQTIQYFKVDVAKVQGYVSQYNTGVRWVNQEATFGK
jgi:hypothetical protein